MPHIRFKLESNLKGLKCMMGALRDGMIKLNEKKKDSAGLSKQINNKTSLQN